MGNELWAVKDWTYGKTRTKLVVGPEKMGEGVAPALTMTGHAAPVRKHEQRAPAAVTPEELEKAERVAACWNACRGIPTEHLEGESINAALAPFRRD